MAASTEIIKMRSAEPTATAYYACIQELMEKAIGQGQMTIQIEALTYCYSAVVSMLELGVISSQSQKIGVTCLSIIQGSYPAMAHKYALMCIQYLLRARTTGQWSDDQMSK